MELCDDGMESEREQEGSQGIALLDLHDAAQCEIACPSHRVVVRALESMCPRQQRWEHFSDRVQHLASADAIEGILKVKLKEGKPIIITRLSDQVTDGVNDGLSAR